MQGTIFHYVLLAGLAIALLFAAYTDLRSRKIANWLTAAIALTAPLFWWSSGLELWPSIIIQIGMSLAAFAALAGLFAFRLMGGGDVKLLAALALWIAPADYLTMLIVMAIVGGVLTLFIGAWNVIQRQPGKLSVPYGIAIAIAGLWILGVNYLPTASAVAGSLG
jgi:prepilin peptidase CpaA